MKKSLAANDTGRQPDKQSSGFELSQALFASIINFSDDAIISKSLDGIITSWNPGAEKLFGFTATEAIGQHISMLLPADRTNEEDEIIKKIRQGEHVNPYETVRLRKDKSLLDISLSVSPVKDVNGNIIGAFKIVRDITEKNRMEKILVESEKKYRTVFENNPMPMWVLKTSDHKFLSVNQAAINHYGYSREEFYNLTAADIRPPEDKESYLQHRITQHIGPHQEGIWKHRKKDGSLITVEIFADDIVYDNQPARLILANDITEKQKAEEETAKSEIRFRNTLDKMLEGVQIYDCNWNCLYLNDAVTKQGPYSKEEVMARSMLENYPGIEQTELFKIFQECIANDKARHIEYEFTFPDLSKKWFELSLQPIPEGLFILSIDITERKKVEEDLRLSLKEISDYKYALDESSIVAITDQKGIIHYANENFCKISKYTHDELIGQDHRIVNSGYHPKEFIRNLWKTISGGHIWRGELKNKAKDGTIYWVDTTIVPFLNEHNKPYQYVAIRADITERKKAEEDLLQLNEQLRNLTAHLQTIRETERTNMAREIHDELGQQLTSLKMDISWLKNKTKTESPHINQKTDGMLEIINDAIRTVRKIVVALRPGILDDLGLEAALEWQAKEFEQRAGIHCFFKASVTHEKFSQQINTTVFRIFQEALTNVMRYANATEVKAELYESNDELILKIKDNGIGIDDADKNKKTSFGLMGMKERASMLHGEFSVDKLPEGGTGITLKIPLQL